MVSLAATYRGEPAHITDRTHRRSKMNNPNPSSRAKRYRVLAAVCAALAALILVAAFVPNFESHRPQIESETVFAFFAESLGEARLCDKISWAAFQRYSVLFGGGGASYARSDCYESVAVRNRDRAVCWNVRPLIDMDPFSTGYSALACRRHVGEGGRRYASITPETEVRAFETLGYDVDQLHLEGVINPAIVPIDVYRSLERRPGIVDRVQTTLANPSSSLSSDDKNLLAHLAAVVTGDARWCERIPASDSVVTEQVPFRDWCYLTVAYNTRDARICDRMAPAASEAKVIAAKANGIRGEIAEQLSAHASCVRIGKWVGPPPHYGAEEPQDPMQIRQLVAELGYEWPRARDWPPYQIAEYYSRFLDALHDDLAADPRRHTARAKLIGRITARSELP